VLFNKYNGLIVSFRLFQLNDSTAQLVKQLFIILHFQGFHDFLT